MNAKSISPFFAMLLIGVISLACMNAAQAPAVSITPNFAAVIVNNLETSAAWYKKVLGGNLGSISSDGASTYRVQILEAPGLIVEILELDDSVDPDGLVSGSTKIRGHFKIGYKVSNLTEFMTQLNANGITVGQVYGSSPNRNFILEDPDGNLVQFFE